MSKLYIYSDVSVTRRQSMHHVMDETNTLRFSAAKIDACFKWCYGEGFPEVVIIGPDTMVKVTIQDVVDASEVMDEVGAYGRTILEFYAQRADN